MVMEVKEVGRETIKPASPTPHHLRNFKLSLLDQISFSEYVSNIFIYRLVDDDHGSKIISQRLKSSLSKALVSFYPFAGRFKDDGFSVECNDDGVEYVEARAYGFLTEYLQNPDQLLLRDFHPFNFAGYPGPETPGSPIVRVQATFFKCGGLAIAICASHKLIDGTSLCIFLNSWATIARASAADDQVAVVPTPSYVAASVFPPSHEFVTVPIYIAPAETNRFVFDDSRIAQLKANVASASVPRPSRVEALIALIWKCAREAASPRSPRPSFIAQAINLRTITKPDPLPSNSVGNSVGYFSAQTGEGEVELQDLVCLLRKSRVEFIKNGLRNLVERKFIYDIPESVLKKIEKEEIDFYVFSSVVNFPIYQAADFGWGKPVHVAVPNYEQPNYVQLMDTNDGKGIEAVVSLSPQHMALFKRNEQLLAFATVNPPVTVTAPDQNKKIISSL